MRASVSPSANSVHRPGPNWCTPAWLGDHFGHVHELLRRSGPGGSRGDGRGGAAETHGESGGVVTVIRAPVRLPGSFGAPTPLRHETMAPACANALVRPVWQ